MAFKRSAVRSRLSPPSGTGKARFDESQNELFLFPPCRLKPWLDIGTALRQEIGKGNLRLALVSII